MGYDRKSAGQGDCQWGRSRWEQRIDRRFVMATPSPSPVHPVLRKSTADPAALDLLAKARSGLAEAALLARPNERYATAHLAALRTAAAVLAARGRTRAGEPAATAPDPQRVGAAARTGAGARRVERALRLGRGPPGPGRGGHSGRGERPGGGRSGAGRLDVPAPGGADARRPGTRSEPAAGPPAAASGASGRAMSCPAAEGHKVDRGGARTAHPFPTAPRSHQSCRTLPAPVPPFAPPWCGRSSRRRSTAG